MSRFLTPVLTFTRAFASQFTNSPPTFKTLFPKGPTDAYISPMVSNSWLFNIIRETHYTFRPKESHRVKRLGFYAKVKTRKGRKQIMRRILKGRFVLTH